MQEQVKGLEDMGCGHQRRNEGKGGGLDEQVETRSLPQAEAALGQKEALSLGHGSP